MTEENISEEAKSSSCTDFENYKKYVEEQRKYHSENSKLNKMRFQWLQLLQIILSALIPLIIVISSENYAELKEFVIAFVGCSLTVITGLQAFWNSQKKWIHHRSMSETIKSEIRLFEQHCGHYKNLSDEERKEQFIEIIEVIISEEHIKWREFSQKDRNKK